MRVLQLDAGREWRGGQNQVRLLCRELARQPGVEQLLVTKRHGELARRAAAEGVDVRPVPWWLGPDPVAAWRTAGIARAFAPDLIHAHDSHALLVALWARRLRRRGSAGALVVATRRVDFPVRSTSPWHRAHHVIAISDAVRRILVDGGMPAARITVVPSGIDVDEVRDAARQPFDVRARLGLAAGTPLAVNVAALVPHKDQATLIRAAGHVRALRPDLHWVVAGDGPERRALTSQIAHLALGDRVHLVGYVREAASLIAEADVFVMSSQEEGLGSVILDALALGRPVVATAGGGIPEILPRDALVPVGDAAGLAGKVARALAQPSPIAFPARCTARAMAEGVLALYRSLSYRLQGHDLRLRPDP